MQQVALIEARLVEMHEHPQLPWYTYDALLWLLENLPPRSGYAFEWGSGSSTMFFARHFNSLLTIEHNPKWFKQINGQIKRSGLNARVLLLQDLSDYIEVITNFEDESFSLISVDGWSLTRVTCLRFAIKKLARGGLLILDNSEKVKFQEAVEAVPSEWQRMDFPSMGRKRPGCPATKRKQVMLTTGNAGMVWNTTIWKRP